MKENELKPCPFCGGKAEIRVNSTYSTSHSVGFTFYICCTKCGTKYPENFNIGVELTSQGQIKQTLACSGVIEQATELWNRRAYEQAD